MNEIRTYVSKRASTKAGEPGPPTYHVRWIDPLTGKWASEKVIGVNGRAATRKQADQEAADLAKKLNEGTFKRLERVTWDVFVDDHCRSLPGLPHRAMARRVLDDFGAVTSVTDPRLLRYIHVEAYAAHIRSQGNSESTVATYIGYLRGAFNAAIRREQIAANPCKGWSAPKSRKKKHRTLSALEEPLLLAAVDRLYGPPMVTFVRFLLETWARLGEAESLKWGDVDFATGTVLFRDTKSGEDRQVELWPDSDLSDRLQRLKAKTLADGGPFVCHARRGILWDKWHRILRDAGIPHCTFHDLRRTGISRALVGGMPPTIVQALAGHRNIATTMKHYYEHDRTDVRTAVAAYRSRSKTVAM